MLCRYTKYACACICCFALRMFLQQIYTQLPFETKQNYTFEESISSIEQTKLTTMCEYCPLELHKPSHGSVDQKA